jgi:hypothetical protein
MPKRWGLSDADLDRLRLIAKQRGSAKVRKAYSQPTPADGTGGLRYYDLRGTASRFNPVYATFRNEIPRRQAPYGTTGMHWKAITAVNTGNVPIGVSEGNRNAAIAQSMTEYFAGFGALGLENFVTDEARSSSRGFVDVDALAQLDVLESLINGEERWIVGGNQTLAFGTAPTPVGAIVATGGALTAQSWEAYIVALTFEGLTFASVANGVATEFSRTNADGSVDMYQGGSSMRSAASAAVGPSAGANSILWKWAAVHGAAGYAVYIGVAGGGPTAARLAAIVPVNEFLQVTNPSGVTQQASAITADHSKNPLAFDGKIIQLAKPGSGATIVSLDGANVTVNSSGTIDEFDELFRLMWDKSTSGPQRFVVNPSTRVAISKAVMAAGITSASIQVTVQIGAGGVRTGIQIESVLNPYTGEYVPFMNHPYFPKGMILAETMRLPYSLNGMDSRPWVIETRQEYYSIRWPKDTRKNEYGCYADEGLIGNIPFSHGLILNVGDGI